MKNLVLRTMLLCISAFVCLSCADKNAYRPPVFSVEKDLKGTCLNNDMLISYAYGMAVDDTYIYILTPADGKWIQVYHKGDGSFVGSYVGRGQGPGEVVMATTFQLSEDGKELYIHDSSQKKQVAYAIHKADNEPILTFKDSQSFVESKGAIRRVWSVGDAWLVDGQLGEPVEGLKRFQLYDGKHVVDSYNDFPVEQEDRRFAFVGSNSQLCFSPSCERMATGTLFGGVMETFAVSEKGLTHQNTYNYYEPAVTFASGAEEPEEGMKYGFGAMCADEEHIYALLIGDVDPNKLNTFSVFDWESKGIARYRTDANLLKLACCPDEPGKLYALAFDAEIGYSLVVYEYSF